MSTTQTPVLGTGTWLSLGSPVVAELAAECGYDWLLLDMEHGVLTEGGLLANLHAAKGFQAKLIVRIGSMDPVLIARVLDWGASGVMLPHVSDVSQALACVQAMRYPPFGKRGYTSGSRRYRYGLSSGQEKAALQPPLFVAQIEDYEGVTNAEEIARVDGVDVLFVGPADLQLDLSTRPLAQQLSFEDALHRVAKAARNAGAQAGILVKDQAEASKFRDMGYSNIAIGSDLKFVREGLVRGRGGVV